MFTAIHKRSATAMEGSGIVADVNTVATAFKQQTVNGVSPIDMCVCLLKKMQRGFCGSGRLYSRFEWEWRGRLMSMAYCEYAPHRI
jgi:hypothetical protein